MNPDIPNLEGVTSLPEGNISMLSYTPIQLIGISILVLVVSHFGAVYLTSITPRGYWFWFTIINL
ncbi:hypothetical protein KBC86_05245, partial [Candidatus Gracilibacteria bacterium]|nr:hypothetical protein [Candidatus Gracilibacteria bacterium]